jgi:FkbM family methyltransferase
MSLLSRFMGLLRPDRTRESYGLAGLDLKLLPYLDFRRGFFIEAGANDGLTQSNTYYLERYMKWRGMLVEPVAELAAKCRANRPKCIVENCALVSADFGGAEVSLRYANLMTVVEGAFKSKDAEDKHVEVGCDLQNVHTYSLQAPASTLSALLDKHRIRKIDFLSLDVEGYELNALQGLDLARHAPRYILVEARYREEIDAYLEPYYDALAVLSHHDVLYARRAAQGAS